MKKATRTNAAYVFAPQNTAYSFTQPEEVLVLVRSSSKETVVQTAINSVVAQRKKT